MPTVREVDYQLEYSESYLDNVHMSLPLRDINTVWA